MQTFVGEALLVTIGYVLGRQGEKIMVVCPADAEGRAQEPPNLGLFPPATRPLTPTGLALPGGFSLEPLEKTLLSPYRPPTTSTTYFCEELVDARLAHKLLLVVLNTCNQALTIQVVGQNTNDARNPNGLVNIGASQSIAATTGKLGFGIDLTTDWYPYMGITFATGGTAPTTGEITVIAYGQRWVRLSEQRA